MEIHLSAGVSTIVALMAAHRAAAGRDSPAPQACAADERAEVIPIPEPTESPQNASGA
jgi:hypothetical protein